MLVLTLKCINVIIHLYEGWCILDFKDLEFNAKEPVYYQICSYIKKAAACGRVKNGEALPSRRFLAAELEINPNTVQKAYKLLEDEGIIKTEKNSASVLTIDKAALEAIKREIKNAAVHEFIKEAKASGLSFREAISLISENWD